MPTEEQRLSFKTKPAEGQRFDYHLFPTAQRGGMSFYPVSGVVRGCKVSNASLVEAATGSNYVQFQMSEGEIKLDGVPIEVSSFGSGDEVVIPLPSAFNDLTQGETDFNYTLVVPVFINPRRTVPVFETGNLPDAVNYNEGDKVIEVSPHAEFDEYLMIRNIFVHDGSEWSPYNRDIIFESPIEGKDWGQNNLPFNSVEEDDIAPANTDVLTANDGPPFNSTDQGIISRLPEKKVYHKSVRPVYVAGPAHAYLRESASLYLANIEFSIEVSGGSVNSITVNNIDSRRARTRMAI